MSPNGLDPGLMITVSAGSVPMVPGVVVDVELFAAPVPIVEFEPAGGPATVALLGTVESDRLAPVELHAETATSATAPDRARMRPGRGPRLRRAGRASEDMAAR